MSNHETDEDLFTARFWERAWNDFFEDFTQPDYWKNAPGAAAQMDLEVDGEGKIVAVDGRPHIQMMLKKVLLQKEGEEGLELKFSTLKSTVVEDVLKKHDLHAMHQNAIEDVRSEHKMKMAAEDVLVPPLLLAALIQYWQMAEAGKSQLARELETIMESYDNHEFPGAKVEVREGVMLKPPRSSEGGRVVAGGKSAEFKPELIMRTETGRFSSQHPNLANKPGFERGNFVTISSETGRSSSNKPNCEQVDADGNPIEKAKVCCCDKVVLIEIPKDEDNAE